MWFMISSIPFIFLVLLQYVIFGTLNVLYIGICGMITVVIVLIYGFMSQNKLSWIPGPIPPLFRGHAYEEQMNTKHFYCDIFEKYGPVAKFFRGTIPIVICQDPDMVYKVGTKQFQIFHNRWRLPIVRPTTGMFLARDAQWKKVRNACIPIFNDRKLRTFLEPMETTVSQVIDLLKNRDDNASSVDVNVMWGQMTMQILGLTCFGVDLEIMKENKKNNRFSTGNHLHPLVNAAANIFKGFRPMENPFATTVYQFPFLGKIAALFNYSYVKQLLKYYHTLDATAYEVVKQRRVDPNYQSYNDFITLLLDAHDHDTNEPLSDIEIRDQINTFMMAGYETTASTLSFATLLLSQNPEQQKQLLNEIDTLAPRGTTPDYDELKKFVYTEAVINETLRLFPVAFLQREASEDIEVGGFFIPKGTQVLCPPHSFNYNSKYFSQPESFQPERFLNTTIDKHIFYPFGQGPRMCIGARFAMEEAKYALIRMYQHFYFTPGEQNKNIKLIMGLTLGTESGILLHVHHRT